MVCEEYENQIIKGLQAGDENSYNQLFNEYYALLSVFATRYVKDIEVAKEIVQDLFVHIFEIHKSLQITTSLKSYMYQSVRNRCLNHIRQVHVNEKLLKTLKLQENSDPNLDDQIMETELEHQIAQIVTELPEKCKMIFIMSRVDGKKNHEIAKILNLSIRTVETQISKAIKVLRRKLQPYLKS